MSTRFAHLVFLAVFAVCPPAAAQDAPKLKPLTEILGDRKEVRELEQSLDGDPLYLARRCLPLMVLLGGFLDEEPGQDELAKRFTQLGEAAILVVERLEAARTEESGRPSAEDVRALAEAIGYAYVGRLMENRENRGQYFEGDPWLEGDVGFCSERIPILAGERPSLEHGAP